jgi:DNA-binding NarL/FixJ family response regulator
VIRWINPAAQRLVGDVRGRQFTSVVAPEDARRSREVCSVRLTEGGRVIGVFGQVIHDVEPAAIPHPHLTTRQDEVLQLLEHGRSTKQIADELHLSRETVRNHVRHVLRALGVHSRLEAVALARRERLVA